MKLASILFILLYGGHCFSQSLQEEIQKHKTLNRNGMYALGSWSLFNIGTGVYQNFKAQNEASKAFHQMNWMWNTVNFSLAASSLVTLKKYNEITDFNQLAERNKKSQRIFLINTGLDVAYMTAGFFGMAASHHFSNPSLARGYGQSILFQGVFLFVFDGSMYLYNKRLMKNGGEDSALQLELMPYGLNIKF